LAVDVGPFSGGRPFQRFSDIADDRIAKAKEAHSILAGLNLEIQVIFGSKTIPDSIEGAWITRDWIEETGANCKVSILVSGCGNRANR
jgi:hypothetical protein